MGLIFRRPSGNERTALRPTLRRVYFRVLVGRPGTSAFSVWLFRAC